MCNPAADRVCLNCEDWARSPFKTVFGIDESRARWVEIAASSYPLRRCPHTLLKAARRAAQHYARRARGARHLVRVPILTGGSSAPGVRD